MLHGWPEALPGGGLAVTVAALLYVADLVIKVIALGVLPADRRPASGMAWLLLVLLVPFAGLGIFLLFGSTHVGRRRRERQEQANFAIAAAAAGVQDPEPAGHSPLLATVLRLNRGLGALPALKHNVVDVIPGYRTAIEEMTKAVDEATVRVHVEFYIAAWDEVTTPLFDALVRAGKRGVDVRFLFDHLGSRGIPGYRDMTRRLDATDIEWHPMLPIAPLKGQIRRPDLRNHRKLLTVDGAVGFTGSQNLVEPGYNKPKNHAAGREWVELVLKLQGPSVRALDAVFASDWLSETGEVVPTLAAREPGPGAIGNVDVQLVPSGPGFETENNLRMFTTLIYSATERVSMTSPYFVPDESLLYAVTTAALRGVDVELFVSEEADQFMVGHAQASYYNELLRSGVRIFLYPAPFVLHAKHFTVDDDIAVVGTSNMDMRSFALNYELSTLLLGEAVVREVRAVEDSYRRVSRELTLEEWNRRPARLRYVDNVMRLTAALQ